MKVTISPTGEISMDTNGSTPAEIAGTILAVQQALHKQQRDEAVEAQELSRPASLNDVQGATYDWMVAHDKGEMGIHISALGRAFGISNGAAGQRCYQLVKDGFATKVCSGRYRAVTQ